jgi:hypothetical protein
MGGAVMKRPPKPEWYVAVTHEDPRDAKISELEDQLAQLARAAPPVPGMFWRSTLDRPKSISAYLVDFRRVANSLRLATLQDPPRLGELADFLDCAADDISGIINERRDKGSSQ